MKNFDEYDFVSDFIEKTGDLEVECVVSALRHCRNGASITEACEMALREWDCEPIDNE